MALILDSDLLCVERGGRSYKWTGAEFKSQVETITPIADIQGKDPIRVTQSNRTTTISILDATTSQKGAVILSNTVSNSQSVALTPYGAQQALDSKANANGSNATGTWNINITGSSPASENSTNSVNAQNIRVDNEDSTNATRYVTFVDGGGGSNRRAKRDNSLTYNPGTNTLTAGTFKGNLNGTASNATTTENATNATNATTARNVDLLYDTTNVSTYVTFSSGATGDNRIRTNKFIRFTPSIGELSVEALEVSGPFSTNTISGSLVVSGSTTLGQVNASTINASGNIIAGGDLQSNSDRTIKKDIEPITGALESLKKVNGVKFKWNSTGKSSMGVIAQEIEEVFPELVKTDAGIRSVTYNGLVGALIEAVKELSARVEQLEASK